ncbi:MAG: hypothetical protein EU535_08705 [Promethearchaeota archaeon]|nr:MAG: hypothetical protein EU535_08705 [Candidatus Lokiarchaeota archaeon]
MKLLKLQVSSGIFSKLGHHRIFEYITMVEIQNVFQNKKNNLFLQAKLVIKEELKLNYTLMENYETIQFFHVLKEKGNEIICLMQITSENSLLPDFGPIPWAFVPPIILDPTSTHFTCIISEESIKPFQKYLSNYDTSYQILAIENLDKTISKTSILIPSFTKRQNEITRYAYRNGYFNSPRGISAEEIGNYFNVSTSAVTKHLRIATEKAMNFFFS